MSKKISFFIIFIFLAIIPAGKILAGQYYVGVAISQGTTAPGYPLGTADTNWCLPNETTIAITDSNDVNLTPIGPTTNPTKISAPGCAGTTIWSGLVDLTSGTNSKINITPGNDDALDSSYQAYCPGFNSTYFGNDGNDNYWCWVAASINTSCTDTCSKYGSTMAYYPNTVFPWNIQPLSGANTSNCAVESFLMGGACSSCTAGATYNFFNPVSHVCSYSQTQYVSGDAGAALPGLVRVCPCNFQYNLNDNSNPHPVNFIFPFTP